MLDRLIKLGIDFENDTLFLLRIERATWDLIKSDNIIYDPNKKTIEIVNFKEVYEKFIEIENIYVRSYDENINL
jgi:hypothetical protein